MRKVRNESAVGQIVQETLQAPGAVFEVPDEVARDLVREGRPFAYADGGPDPAPSPEPDQ